MEYSKKNLMDGMVLRSGKVYYKKEYELFDDLNVKYKKKFESFLKLLYYIFCLIFSIVKFISVFIINFFIFIFIIFSFKLIFGTN